MWQVLHITDLHICDPKGPSEYLREGFYEEYLDTLIVKIRPLIADKLDCIVVTGDFIDAGKIENFDHASKVVNYLANKFRIDPTNVAVCNGNHDIQRDHELKDAFKEARQPFVSFARQFANGKAIKAIDQAMLLKISDGLWALMLDATLGSDKCQGPGTLDTHTADTLMNWIREIPSDHVLIIGTHYPVHSIMSEAGPFDEDNPIWAKQHLWHSGVILKDRIQALTEPAQVIWVCGDIHKNFNLSHNQQHFLATGRLGTATGLQDSQVRRHARLIAIADAKTAPISRLFEFEPKGHSSQPHLGRWKTVTEEYTAAQTIELIIAAGPAPSTSAHELRIELDTEPRDELSVEESETGFDGAAGAAGEGQSTVVGEQSIELIDVSLQDELMRTIRDSRLYHFARFDTSKESCSLSWVSIGPLLNEGDILYSTINAMVGWLRTKIDFEKDESFESSLLIGLDCWGAVIASQVSVQLGVPNLCVAERGGGEHYVAAETLVGEVFEPIRKAKNIILISDVVATGLSLKRVYAKICEGAPEARECQWLALSIICDDKQQRTADCTFLTAHGTACKDLRMPILPAASLASESILPPQISF
jgi:hypothetical protein